MDPTLRKRLPLPKPQPRPSRWWRMTSSTPRRWCATRPNDDRDTIQEGDLVLLIVENDLAFARFLLDAARARASRAW
jgi:hypothetical protein